MGDWDRGVSGSLFNCFGVIMTCLGDSFLLPVNGTYDQLSHSGGVGWLTRGSSAVRGCLGKSGVTRIGGRRDDEATGVWRCGAGGEG